MNDITMDRINTGLYFDSLANYVRSIDQANDHDLTVQLGTGLAIIGLILKKKAEHVEYQRQDFFKQVIREDVTTGWWTRTSWYVQDKTYLEAQSCFVRILAATMYGEKTRAEIIGLLERQVNSIEQPFCPRVWDDMLEYALERIIYHAHLDVAKHLGCIIDSLKEQIE